MLVPTPIATFDTSVHSPADCSAAVCAPGAEVGSLGCLVQMDGARYVLGSAHVMIASAIAMGPGQLYQPPIDHPGYRPIAKPYAAAIAVKDGVTVNTLDAALAEVLDPKAVSAKLGGLGFPAGFRTTALAVGERVRIHGAGGRQVAFGKVQQTAFTALARREAEVKSGLWSCSVIAPS